MKFKSLFLILSALLASSSFTMTASAEDSDLASNPIDQDGPEQVDDEQYKVTLTELRIKDVNGQEMTECDNCLSSLVMLSAEMKNELPSNESFIVYFEVRDLSTGYAIFNEFATGSLIPDEFREVAISWKPEHAGNYELRSFVMESLQHMENMSQIETTQITVT